MVSAYISCFLVWIVNSPHFDHYKLFSTSPIHLFLPIHTYPLSSPSPASYSLCVITKCCNIVVAAAIYKIHVQCTHKTASSLWLHVYAQDKLWETLPSVTTPRNTSLMQLGSYSKSTESVTKFVSVLFSSIGVWIMAIMIVDNHKGIGIYLM